MVKQGKKPHQKCRWWSLINEIRMVNSINKAHANLLLKILKQIKLLTWTSGFPCNNANVWATCLGIDGRMTAEASTLVDSCGTPPGEWLEVGEKYILPKKNQLEDYYIKLTTRRKDHFCSSWWWKNGNLLIISSIRANMPWLHEWNLILKSTEVVIIRGHKSKSQTIGVSLKCSWYEIWWRDTSPRESRSTDVTSIL